MQTYTFSVQKCFTLTIFSFLYIPSGSTIMGPQLNDSGRKITAIFLSFIDQTIVNDMHYTCVITMGELSFKKLQMNTNNIIQKSTNTNKQVVF